MKSCYYWLLGMLLILGLNWCETPSVLLSASATPTRDDNVALGFPSRAEAPLFSPTDYLITRSTYSLSCNNAAGIANLCS